MFPSFFNSLTRSRYSSFFSLSLDFAQCSVGTAKSTIRQVLFFLLIITRSGRLADIRWSVCISKSQRSLCVSFSWTDSGLCIYHSFELSNFNFLHNSQWITLPTLSCLVLYSFSAAIIIIIICFFFFFVISSSVLSFLFLFLYNFSLSVFFSPFYPPLFFIIFFSSRVPTSPPFSFLLLLSFFNNSSSDPIITTTPTTTYNNNNNRKWKEREVLGLCLRTKKALELEDEGDTICKWHAWNDP